MVVNLSPENYVTLRRFIEESNLIEGITRYPPQVEVRAYKKLLGLDSVTVDTLTEFVQVIQPVARLRDHDGMNVFVGEHAPPAGGEHVATLLKAFLRALGKVPTPASYAQREATGDPILGNYPFEDHRFYEFLHPYTDGNGRSGRALWLWQMVRANGWGPIENGFLKEYYLQALRHWSHGWGRRL